MNKVKKRTLIDKCRDGYRAFRGKQLGSMSFGVDVKTCWECDYRRGADILYLCDRQACPNCSYPNCEYTTDIRHAMNFEYVAGYVREVKHEIHE